MNVFSLPAKIREQVEPILESSTVVAIARMRGSLGGSSGEGYIVALDDRMYVYSRSLGDYEYTQHEFYYMGDIQLLEMREERFSLMLELTSSKGEKLDMKFAKYQDENIVPIVQQWRSATGTAGQGPAPAAAPAAGEVPGMDPYVAGIAVLIFVAAVDNEIDPAEEEYILRFSGGENAVFQAAHSYYENHEYEELLAAIGVLDEQQKMCILANAMDLAMADGVLHKNEQELVTAFAEKVGISEDNVNRIRDTLLVKNQISVLAG